jgi:eukaryotic-like serine/threonine-protein kinase
MMETKGATLATRRHAAPVADRAANGDGERYELLGELATGGMATVYLGRMRRPMGFARLVAIKCMHPQYAKDPSFASMFLDEARLTARLRHPNIVPTLDIVADGGHLLIVMEYVEGESLAGLLRLVRDAGSRIPVTVACAIIHDLLLGLHEAHEARDDDGSPLAIIHRDVSPQNVIVGLDGLARVLDFGVAKARSRVHHSNEGEIKGKIPYMPPEQLFGEGVDRRVDIYAAGVLLWEALAGQRLFDGSNEESIVRRIDAGEVAAPSTKASGISPELDALVLRALCKDRDGRFPTALAMAEALSSIATLPPRTEISAWIKLFAKPRSVPADAIGTSTELASESVSPDELVAVLERATVATRPSFVPVASSGPRPAPPATSRLAMVLGVAAFALAGVLVGRAMRAETAHAESAHRAPPPAAQTSEPAVAITPALPETKVAPPSEPVAAPVAKATARKSLKPSAPTTKDTAPAAKPAAEVTAAPTPDPKPPSCRLPYDVDAEGHRHYRIECL